MRRRIPNTTAILMISVALLFDLIQFILTALFIGMILNPVIVTPLAWFTFFLWYKFRGVNITDKVSRFATMTVTPLIEFIPMINALPAWTLGVFIMISIVKAEDIAYNKAEAISKEMSLRQFRRSRRVEKEQYA